MERSNRHFVVGIVILVIGVILLLDQLGFTEANKLWPLLLIYFGVNKLRRSRGTSDWFWGGFLALLGVSLELEELGIGHIRLGTIWPVFLICVGILLVVNRYEMRRRMESQPPPPPAPANPPAPGSAPPSAGDASQSSPANAAEGATASSEASAAPGQTQAPPPPPGQPNYSAWGWDPEAWRRDRSWQRFQRRMDRMSARMNQRWGPGANWAPNSGQPPNFNWQSKSNWQSDRGWYDSTQSRLDEVNVFWGGRKRIISKSFTGGEIVAIFGGFEVDLTEADFPGDQIELEIVTIFGGGEVRVPTNWDVMIDNVGIFGGASDRTVHPPAPSQAAPGTPATKRLVVKGVSIFGGIGIKN